MHLSATIVPRSGGSAGHVTLKPSKEAPKDEPHTRASLLARLRVLLAGREAEAIFLGDDHVSIMAESDVTKALGVARALARFGFDADSKRSRAGPSVDEDNAARKFLENERRNVHRALVERKETVRRLADALLEKHTLANDEIRTIFRTGEDARKIPPLVRWIAAPFEGRKAARSDRAPALVPAADQRDAAP